MNEDSRQRDDEVWAIEDVARFLKVSKSTVRNRVKDGSLPIRRIGRLVRFVPAEVREWVGQQEAA